MITCREDLYNTYVRAKDKELLTVFMRTFMDKLPDRADYSLDDYVESVSSFEVVMILPHYRSPQIATSKTDLSKLRELTMADFIPSNDVKYYDKDEEIKPQDGFVINAIKDFKVSQEKTNHKWERFQDCYAKTKEELMIDNKEDYIGLTGNHQMNCILNDMQSKVRVLLKRIKHHDDDVDSLVDRVRFIEELVDMAIDGIVVESSEKPRTKTEYIKLNKNDKEVKFWEVARDFAESEGIALYFLIDDSYLPIVSNERLLAEYKDGNLYRKVEKQITWYDDVIDYLESFSGDECKTFIETIMENKNTGAEGHHYEGFINMCRLVVESVDNK